MSIGSCVSLSRVMTYFTDVRSERSPTISLKLVSIAPRTSRLNSISLPRFRSQPIHNPSASFH